MDKIIDKEIDMAGKYRVRVLRLDGAIEMLKFSHDPLDTEIGEEIAKIIERENANGE